MNSPFEKRIRLTICMCQLTAVLSCVSMVYLAVAIYTPSYRTLNAGFSEDTVMCTTVSNTVVQNCEEDGPNSTKVPSWGSCGEWCLSKSSGSCTQIRVDVRFNGSKIRLENCDPFVTKYCHGIDPKMKVYKCIDGECGTLNGIFNCTTAPTLLNATGDRLNYTECKNLTSVLSCNFTNQGPPNNCSAGSSQCSHLDHGLYTCNNGACARVLPPFKCDKRCISIDTKDKNVLIRQGDIIHTASCAKAVDIETELEIWPYLKTTNIDHSQRPPTLMMFCTNLHPSANDSFTTYTVSDCFNGTLLDPDHFGDDTNISYVLQSHYDSFDRPVDEEAQFVPPEQDLLIYNRTPLFINFEGCVNTLILHECEKFHHDYGGDGSDQKSESRFPCYYSPNMSEFVVLRFSRMKTIMEVIIAVAVPVTLAIVSCFTLALCTKVIHVSDDSHFYYHGCGGEDAKPVLKRTASVDRMSF